MENGESFKVNIQGKVPAKAVGCIITDMYIQRDPMCPKSWVEFTKPGEPVEHKKGRS